MKRLFTLLAATTLLVSTVANAQTALVGVDGPAEDARALQLLTLQALQEAGLSTADPEALHGNARVTDLVAQSKDIGGARTFMLRAIPMQTARLLVLEEVAGAAATTVHRASLMLDQPSDADRVLGRLVRAVIDRTSPDEASVSTVTSHEGRAYAKRPGEFLWGFGVLAGLGLDNDRNPMGLFGGEFRALYEIDHAHFGVSTGGAVADDGGLFDLTIFANYLFLDGNFSPYVGGGFGISYLELDDFESDLGAHFTLSAGVEMFRLHSTRIIAGLDVMLPLYQLDGWDDDDEWDYDDDDKESFYTPVPMFKVAILF